MRFEPPADTIVAAASFNRPPEGVEWVCDEAPELPLTGAPAWQSNGGPHRGHPARSLPFSLDVELTPEQGTLVRIMLVGVFALWADREHEPLGTLGCTIQLTDDQGLILYRQDLLNGRHYTNASRLDVLSLVLGDGTSIETLGNVRVNSGSARVDAITIDVPSEIAPTHLRFKDLGSPASFLIFDVITEYKRPLGCPFRARTGGVALSEIASIVRMGDRVKLEKAINQLHEGLLAADDLDEARSQALTFLAMVTAGMLELGGRKEMHRVQLDAARGLDALNNREEIAEYAANVVREVTAPLYEESSAPSGYLVDKALAFVERHYARDLSDAAVAEQLGLSTSHFRYLFRQATGQPFHKYLVGMRLEKARQMLLERELPISEVAAAVGFAGLSHFSRAFTQRFSVSPTNLRKLAR